MNLVKVSLPTEILDGYIYSGHLFGVFPDGTLRSLPISTLVRTLEKRYPQWRALFEIALLRNDWLHNKQAKVWSAVPSVSRALRTYLRRVPKAAFHIEPAPELWSVVAELPESPVL